MSEVAEGETAGAASTGSSEELAPSRKGSRIELSSLVTFFSQLSCSDRCGDVE